MKSTGKLPSLETVSRFLETVDAEMPGLFTAKAFLSQRFQREKPNVKAFLDEKPEQERFRHDDIQS